VTWVTMRLKSGNAVDSFWSGNEIRARGPVLQIVRPELRARGRAVLAIDGDSKELFWVRNEHTPY